MELKLTNFEEALSAVKTGKTNYMIRMAWTNGIPWKKILNLSETTYLKKRELSNGLFSFYKSESINGILHETYEDILRGSDILADDWIYIPEWRLFNNENEITNVLRKENKNGSNNQLT